MRRAETKQADPDRFQFSGSLSRRQVRELAGNEKLRVVQFVEPVETKTLDRLNDSLFTVRPDVELRVYGFYGTSCDLSFLSRMTHLRRLSADCLLEATGIEAVTELPALEQLGVGIYSLEDFGFLNDVTDGLTKLGLHATFSKKPDLSPLSRFARLETLYLEGQRKNITVLAELKRMQNLTLRSITVPSLEFLRPLRDLRSLDIKLGGTRNLAALEGMEQIRYLELWQIRKLEDIGVVSSLTGLQYLFLQALRRVRALPELRRLTRLRRIYLDTMKGLVDVGSLRCAPSLIEFIHIAANNLQPEHYIPLLENPGVEAVRIGFGSDRKNKAFEALMREHGKVEYRFHPFEFGP